MSALAAWLGAFGVTVAVEAPIYAAALGERPLLRRLTIAVGASALTHPLVYLVLPQVWRGSYAGYVLTAEAFAVLAEGLYLGVFRVSRPWTLALVANLASTVVGLGLRHLTGWP